MGEKGSLTSGELAGVLEGGNASALAGAASAAAPGVTTVVTDGGTTIISAASSLAEKVVDKSVDVGGDTVAERLKQRGDGSDASGTDDRPSA